MPARDMPRIVVTGIGAVTPLGNDAQTTWRRVLAGDCAVQDWPDLAALGHRAVRACRVVLPATAGQASVAEAQTRRGRTLALWAAREALAQAGRPAAPDDRHAGIFVGSTLGESAAFEAAAAGQAIDLSGYRVPAFCQALAQAFELSGPQEALATACAAGNYAVGAAALALRQGRVPWALAGGVEPFSQLALVGFSRSRAMAQGDCKPFDAQRTGMLLGEGAAMLVLERADDAMARGATVLAEVHGLGLSCDAHHPTAPRPDGLGMARAMRAALAQSGFAPSDVDWVNLHGTGTRASDAAEGLALRSVFTGLPMPLLSGSKGALGHALGAASAIELALCVSALQHRVLPPTAGHSLADPEIGLDCTRVATRPGEQGLRVVMNNAFAFGGVNSTLMLSQWDAAWDAA